ncbi:hypothetical protein GXW74_19765 [Roseomonas eburnea]|uniref:Uncharacterized protein n=1 Tax=Neoroseomonas eburnea TaxID=1346889 RepID=A0A9X9XGA3_9PROT|nr:hypothetical protein [Neoroseomonas eburnea]MBR0682739.1 hypothetical protein [Neoroseomonas eburnea]
MAATDNIAKCLGDAVDAGRISREGAERALREVKRVFDENPGVSEGAAAARAAETLKADAALRKRQAALQVTATDRVLQDVASHPEGAYRGTWAVFVRDLTGKATYSNVDGWTQAVRGILYGKIADVLDAYRAKNLGLTRDTIGLQRFIRDLYGEASGDPVAANAARAWSEAAEYARQRFNAAGGNIPRKEAWRLPQHFDTETVKRMGRAGFEDWMHRAVEDGRLRIWDYEANAPVDPIRRAEIISQAFERIDTNGLSDLTPGQAGSAKLANSRSDRRAFEWTTADAWLEANRTFGGGDAGIFDLLVNHIDGMARDIAMLEILGPNPNATARVLIDSARKAGVSDNEAWYLENAWNVVNGTALSPVAGWKASFFGGVRAWLSSAQLGSAVLSSVSDFQTMRQTAAWNGLGSNGIMGEYFRLLNPANAADRKLAVRAGLIADGWAHRARAAQRTMFEEIGQTLPARISDFVMRISGMNAHTQAAKWAFGMEFLGRLADDAGHTFDALDPALRRTMERYGLTAAEWNLIRTKGLHSEDGVDLIFPENMMRDGDRAAERAATRLLEMIDAERGFAVLEPGAAEKALTLQGTRAGTWSGEFWRATTQYKSFPITMMTRHLYRGFNAGGATAAGLYLARLAVGLTAFGAFAMQMKEIAKGRDPRDMTDWRFWGAAFFQGGGAGIVGDFLNSSLNRADTSFYMTAIGGPTAGLADDLARLTMANISATTEGKDANWGRDAARFVRRNTPGTSLWYMRLALDRLMWDQLQAILDPDAARSWRRTEQRARQETRQEFWWRPGEAGPERGPALDRAIGLDGR